jgi:hypothetical protein
MFTANFANKVLLPVANLQPTIVAGPMHFSIRLILSHPAIFDTVVAVVQFSIGILILSKKTVKIGLLLSVFWALGVWYFGEGLNGMLSWHTTLFMGLPGAALIYAILAVASLPIQKDNQPSYWLPIFWSSLWIIGTLYLLLPGQNTTADSVKMFNSMAVGAPNWIAYLEKQAAFIINDLGYWFVGGVVIIQLVIGFFAIAPGVYRKIGVYLGIAVSLLYWTIGQQLGGFYTGLATDLNSGPLFIILGLSILACDNWSTKEMLRKAVNDLTKILV